MPTVVGEPTDDPDVLTKVYAWSDEDCEFVYIPTKDVVCSECGTAYNDEWWWDDIPGDYPILVCECGEQFHQTD